MLQNKLKVPAAAAMIADMLKAPDTAEAVQQTINEVIQTPEDDLDTTSWEKIDPLTQPEILIMTAVDVTERADEPLPVQQVELTLDEFLRFRYTGTTPLEDYPEGTDPFEGMLVRIIATAFRQAGLPFIAIELFSRFHGALFNPTSPSTLQVNLANRTLRAFMGAQPANSMRVRAKITDAVTELGDWALVFRKDLMPWFIRTEPEYRELVLKAADPIKTA